MASKKLGESMEMELEAKNQKFEEIELANAIDERVGFVRYTNRAPRTGWLINMNSVTKKFHIKTIVKDPEWPSGRAAVEYYFIEEDGCYFKASITYSPYFFVLCKVRYVLRKE